MIPCAVVPSHDHWQALPGVVESLRAHGLPVFIVDDGSGEPARTAIAALHAPEQGVKVLRLPVNRGKGTAVIEGFRLAHAAGFTHALQADADGQHDLAAVGTMLDLAQANPDALITGEPRYDASIPTARKIGRWVTHVWVWIETLSFGIKDSMCGLRVYPLAPVIQLLAAEPIGRRMDFDTDIMVRLFWRRVSVLGVPVSVTYPPGNSSNFDPWRDNLRISWMHTRLVFGLLVRLSRTALIGTDQRPSTAGHGTEARHWAELAERGGAWGLTLGAWLYRLLGSRLCLLLLTPAVGWFLLTGSAQRRASRAFLDRALGRPASLIDAFRHFLSFAGRALDTFGAWTGVIAADRVVAATPEALRAAVADPRGALIVVAHHGNVDIARAQMDDATRRRMTVLVHTRHARNYNALLRRFRPDAALNLLEVTDIGPDTAITLKDRVESGAWVVIAGDRVPVGEGGRSCKVSFFGHPASFSQGPWILAGILACPVHLLFCRKDGGTWQLSLEPFAERVVLPRGQRVQAVTELASRYAARLEDHCRRAPFQWFNFFDFWQE